MKSILLLSVFATLIPAQTPVVVATGLDAPYKLAMTPAGNILVAETGAGPNSGRITWINRNSGAKTILISGLPSVVSDEGSESISGLIVRERTVFALVGEGDVLIGGTVPGTEIPNPKAASSPIFSSLLAFRFSADLEAITRTFTLSAPDQVRLSDGLDVELDNGAGAHVTVQIIANFPDFLPDPNTIARGSHPFGMDFDLDNPNLLYIADSGQNKVLRVDVSTGRTRTVVTFPPLRNTSGFGPPVSDVVPTSVRTYGDQLLVTYLTGFPFTPGAAGVYAVDPRTGAFHPFLANTTAMMDILVRDRGQGRPQFFALEFSGNMLAQPPLPGRLLQYDTDSPAVLQGGLIAPVSMVMDARTGEIFVSELATGRIVRMEAR